MQVAQSRWSEAWGWEASPGEDLGGKADLVLVFASRSLFEDGGPLEEVRDRYPAAHVMGCSTAGEIRGTQVADDTLVATAVRLEGTRLAGERVDLAEVGDSRQAGEVLAQALDPDGLVHVFVLSDGTHVNGSDLVRGLTAHLPPHVTVTGGLSGDGTRFQETVVLWDGVPRKGAIAILGFYGDRLRVGCASLGGWDPFGPERLVTRSEGSVLYELDGRSALALYKEYLGEHAKGLPATGLLFPLSIRTPGSESSGLVRTILSVDERDQSLTFAGDVPRGAYARLMMANVDRLVDGAVGAARNCTQAVGTGVDLAILISCVGRKLILKQRVEEEIEAVRDVLGERAVLAGFYSYGEISPFTPSARCELHNQTMTVTTFSER